MRINTKSNGKQKLSEDRKQITFLLASLLTYLKSIAVRTDHKRMKENRNVVLLCNADKEVLVLVKILTFS